MAVSPLRAQPSACEPPCPAPLPCPPFPRTCRSPSPAATRPAPVHGHRFVTALTTNQEPGCNPQILAHARLISEIKSELNYQAWRTLLVPPPCCRAQHGSAAPRGGRARLAESSPHRIPPAQCLPRAVCEYPAAPALCPASLCILLEGKQKGMPLAPPGARGRAAWGSPRGVSVGRGVAAVPGLLPRLLRGQRQRRQRSSPQLSLSQRNPAQKAARTLFCIHSGLTFNL